MSEVTGISADSATAASDVSDQSSANADSPSNQAVSSSLTAGALLRQARQAKGLHIAALAVSLKVPQRKLEALEADRYGELPDATFVRALAQTVCRALKVDPAPILALLPQTLEPKLDRVSSGLNQPFRERPGREDPKHWSAALRPGPLAAIGLMVAAAALYLAPAEWWSGYGNGAGEAAPQAVSAASAVSEGIFPPGANGAVVAVSVEPAPPLPVAPDAAASTSASPVAEVVPVTAAALAPAPAATKVTTDAAALQMRASEQTWIEVTDANGQTLISRNLAAGEDVGMDGALPLKLKIGNAAGIKLQFRGKSIDLTPHTRENVARLEVK